MNRILLVDDDVELCALLSEYLQNEGFSMAVVHDGQSAIDSASEETFDLMVLDVMLPQIGGLDVLRSVRARTEVPVLMLTARGEDIDRIIGLELGADDYLPKPCNPRELVARIRAILRRTSERRVPEPGAGRGDTIRVDDVELRPGERAVTCGEHPVELTSTEFDVLQVLLCNSGTVVAKETVSEQALGRPLEAYDRAIDMHVSRIRKKLGPTSNGQARIKTVRGTGYMYVDFAEA